MKKKKIKVISFLVMVMISIFIVPHLRKVSGNNKSDYVKVVVYPGDTLWNIAQKYGSDDDIRKTIFQIRKVNNLGSPIIQPGQELLIPVN